MPPRGYRHLSIKEDVWALLEEGARRRGFTAVSSYIAYLVNVDLALTELPDKGDANREYLYAITRSSYVPFSTYQELYSIAEDAGMESNGFNASRAFAACVSAAHEKTRLEDEDIEKLCMAIADILLAKNANTLVWVAAHKCRNGFRVEIEALKGGEAKATARCVEE